MSKVKQFDGAKLHQIVGMTKFYTMKNDYLKSLIIS